jgi:hypothetical protein
MFYRFTARTLLASLALALAAAPAALAQNEVEPNNTIVQANVLPSTNTTVTGTYSSNADNDYFRFTLTETSVLTISIWGPTAGVCPPINLNYDPVLYLYNAGGTQIATNDDFGSLCARIDVSNSPVVGALPAGTYYIRASLLTNLTNAMYTLVVTAAPTPQPIAESFTYQGRLESSGSPVTGDKQLKFSLWSHPTSTLEASRLSLPILFSEVAIVNGLVNLDLNFTIANAQPNYDGTERYLQIEVAESNGNGGFTVLEPRQRLSPAPHAIYALRSGSADRATLADNATSAGNAVNAQFASFASSAQSADTALSASTANTANIVPWSGIAGIPGGFADNTDNTGSWVESASVSYSNKNIGIDTSNPGAFNLAVNGSAAKTGGGSWSVFSDARLKHNITPMSGTLDRLLQLRGYTFEYNTEAVTNRLALPGIQIGLIAQEVQRVFPDWVETDEQGYLFVTERATTALMVEALRDLRSEKNKELEDANAEIRRLRQEIEGVTFELRKLQKLVKDHLDKP